jgi:hypothetical protein
MSIRKLVAGVGTVQEPDPVLQAAAGLSARSGLPLELVHAFDVSDPFVDTYLRLSTHAADPLRHYAEGMQARLEGVVGGMAGECEVHCRAEAGEATAILHEATVAAIASSSWGPRGAGVWGRRSWAPPRSGCSTEPGRRSWCCTASWPPVRESSSAWTWARPGRSGWWKRDSR